MRPYLKKTIMKKSGVAQGIGPEFKPQYCKKEKRRKEGKGKKRKKEQKARTRKRKKEGKEETGKKEKEGGKKEGTSKAAPLIFFA
jgi:hypothetical protein